MVSFVAAVHEIREEVDVISQIPPNPRAVLLIAHEGNGTPLTYWEPRAEHPRCTGTPDHVSIVRNAVSRGFAVIAVKSVRNFWVDWPPHASPDAHNVTSILSSWAARNRLERAPLVGLGSGCGGNFISMLALSVKFSALVLMVSAGLSKAFEQATTSYPRVLFIHMPKDHSTYRRIEQHVHVLTHKGVETTELSVEEFVITPFFFSAHIKGFGSDASSKLYSLIQSRGFIDARGRVIALPQLHEIEGLLKKFDVLPLQQDDDDYVGILTDQISSLVRVAHGRHAVTGRKCLEIFTWLDEKLWGDPACCSRQESPTPRSSSRQQKLPFSRFAVD